PRPGTAEAKGQGGRQEETGHERPQNATHRALRGETRPPPSSVRRRRRAADSTEQHHSRWGRSPRSRGTTAGRRCDCGFRGTPFRWSEGSDGANVGTARAGVTASKPEASLISLGSLNA